MTDPTPCLTEKAKRQAEERNRRLAQALKSNIARRKDQARSRRPDESEPAPSDGKDLPPA